MMFPLLAQRVASRGALPALSSANIRLVSLSRAATRPVWSRTFVSTPRLLDPAAATKAKARPVESTETAEPKTKKAGRPAGTQKSAAPKRKPRQHKAKATAVLPKLTAEDRPPKRPPTAYLLYLVDFSKGRSISSVQEAHANTRLCAESWNNMTLGQKQPYIDKSRKACDEFLVRKEEYLRNTPSDIQRRVNAERKKKGKPRVKFTGVKSPATPFIRFYKEFFRSESSKHETVAEVALAAGAKWRSYTDVEKKPYVDAYQKDLEVFKAEKKSA